MTLNGSAVGGGSSLFAACNTNNIVSTGAGIQTGTGGTGTHNFFSGLNAGKYNTSGSNNFFVGQDAGCANQSGDNNTYIGRYVGRYSNGGTCNIAIGYGAGRRVTGNNNTILGGAAGATNTTGSYNTFIGRCTGGSVTTGSCNFYVGRYSGMLATGSNNILLGNSTGYQANPGLANITTESNRIILGNTSHTCAQIQVAWTAVSDARDKCIYGAVNKGLGFLKDVNPIEFAFKDRATNELIGDGKKRYGFSAQEILSLEGDKPVIVSNDNPDKLFLTNDYLVPVLVNAIKELNAKVETLESKVRDLENK